MTIRLLALLPLLILAACDASQSDDNGPRTRATVYSGGGMGLTSVPVIVQKPDGTQTAVNNAVIVPSK